MESADIDSPMSEAPTRPLWSLPPPRTRLPSSELGPKRAVVRKEGKVYTACPKTAHSKGGMSWIWQYGTEMHRAGVLKPDWLYNDCWDKRVTVIFSIITTTPAIKHLRDRHRLNKEGLIIERASEWTLSRRKNIYESGIEQISDGSMRATARFLVLRYISNTR
jgi:hypothetical protein